MKRFIVLIALVAGIPIGGFLVGSYIQADYENQWKTVVAKEAGQKGLEAIRTGHLSLATICSDPDAGLKSVCQTYRNVALLQNASIIALLAGLGLLLIIFLGARLAASNRSLLLTLFSPGIKAVMIALFALILVQGAIATYGAYIFESTTVHRVHFFLIGGIGLGALLGAFAMIRAGFSISTRASITAIGKTVYEEAEPRLWKFVKEIAVRLGARPPRNIVLGLEPNFYITSADVIVYPEGYKKIDQTLFMSLPLMRILSRDELTAVVGHELGHYRGEDTEFSLRYYPIYAGTAKALAALDSESEGARSLALLPAFAILSFFMDQFARSEKTIGRDRELEADKVGASAASGRALATSLLKIGAFGPLWHSIKSAMVTALNEGKAYANLSTLFSGAAASSGKPEILNAVATSAMAHPTDTHPPTSMRIQALGLSIADLQNEALTVDSEGSISGLLQNPTAIEEELTKIEHQVILELGLAQLPEGDQQP